MENTTSLLKQALRLKCYVSPTPSGRLELSLKKLQHKVHLYYIRNTTDWSFTQYIILLLLLTDQL